MKRINIIYYSSIFYIPTTLAVGFPYSYFLDSEPVKVVKKCDLYALGREIMTSLSEPYKTIETAAVQNTRFEIWKFVGARSWKDYAQNAAEWLLEEHEEGYMFYRRRLTSQDGADALTYDEADGIWIQGKAPLVVVASAVDNIAADLGAGSKQGL